MTAVRNTGLIGYCRMFVARCLPSTLWIRKMALALDAEVSQHWIAAGISWR